jgi:glycosyltransferase involved in cell wall biosynthesis
MRKIAFYISSLHKAGAEHVCVQLAEHFFRCGWQVTVATQYDDRGLADSYDLPEGITRRISEPSRQELGRSRIRNFLLRYSKLCAIWKEEAPDLIVSFIGKNNVMALQTAKHCHIPAVVCVRGDPEQEYLDMRVRQAAFRLFPKAAGVVLQTRQSALFFPEAVRKKVKILPNPVDPAFLSEDFPAGKEPYRRIVSVGRVDENKNQWMLIEAFSALAEEFPDAVLEFYGTGPKMEEWKKDASVLDGAGQIRFMGHEDNVAGAIRGAAAFVLTSDTEGMPNALLEAMALGLPVISTDCPCGGPAELIRSGENGLLIPVRDTWALEEALRDVLSDPEKAAQMGKKAKETGLEHEPGKVLSEWENYLAGLIGDSKGKAGR